VRFLCGAKITAEGVCNRQFGKVCQVVGEVKVGGDYSLPALGGILSVSYIATMPSAFDLSIKSHRAKLTKQADELLGRPRRKKSKVPNGMPKDDWTKATRGTLLNKNNEAEAHVRELLRKGKVLYHRERPFDVNGKRYFVDFHAQRLMTDHKRLRVCIEIDGGYHFTPEQQLADRRKDTDLLKCSRVWSILRIRWDIAMRMGPDDLVSLLVGMKRDEVRRIY